MPTKKQNFGYEGTTVEFKTSIVISAGDHKKDQTFVVFTAACAMMNTDGGDIYIGVKDNGEPALGPNYGINGDKAKLGLMTNDEFARWINAKIPTYFCDDKYVRGIMHAEECTEDVVCIKIKKANRVVYMHERTKTKSIAYRREGASTRIMDNKMIAQREEELTKEKAERSESRKQERIRLRILEAIDKKKKIKIGYYSSNSDSKSDRILEPIKLICDERHLWAYEEAKEDSNPCRQFKMSRIIDIQVLDEVWTHESSHKEPHIDAFEWSRTTEPSIHISIMIGPAAKNHLIETTPEAEKYLTPNSEDQWFFDTDVHSLEPVKHFCRDFMDTITVYVPDELKQELGIEVQAVNVEKEERLDVGTTLEIDVSKEDQEGSVTVNAPTQEGCEILPSYGIIDLLKKIYCVIEEHIRERKEQKRILNPA